MNNLTIIRAPLFQSVRWILVGISIILSVLMISTGVASMFKMPFDWAMPLFGLMMIAFITPLGLIAWFGIRGEYGRFFTTVIFILSFLILIFTASALRDIHFTDFMEGRFQPGLFEASVGILLSLLQLAAPFVPAVIFYRIFMKVLSNSGLSRNHQ